MKYVVDSSLIIDKLREGSNWDIFFHSTSTEDEFYLSSLSIFEIFSGKSTLNSEIAKKIKRVLNSFKIIPITKVLAIRAGELFRDLNGSLDAIDVVIAATALELNATVVTLNQKHFSQITGLKVYQW